MGKETTETVNKVNAKLALFKALKEAGYRTELDSSSVPTVICKNADDMENTIKEVKKIVKDLEYNSSFGVRIMRRGDINLVEDFMSKVASGASVKYVDDSKVTDHYAIIPTGDTSAISGLSSLERSVYIVFAIFNGFIF